MFSPSGFHAQVSKDIWRSISWSPRYIQRTLFLDVFIKLQEKAREVLQRSEVVLSINQNELRPHLLREPDAEPAGKELLI
jgi:hypothetical protein